MICAHYSACFWWIYPVLYIQIASTWYFQISSSRSSVLFFSCVGLSIFLLQFCSCFWLEMISRICWIGSSCHHWESLSCFFGKYWLIDQSYFYFPTRWSTFCWQASLDHIFVFQWHWLYCSGYLRDDLGLWVSSSASFDSDELCSGITGKVMSF